MSEQEKNQETSDPREHQASDVPPEAGEEASSHEELRLLLEDARAKADSHQDQLLRTRAELENLRKRSERELENAHKFALEKFVTELLPVRDSLEMGISAAAEGGQVDPTKLKEGVELTLKMLADTMQKFGIHELDPEGEKFNPELHQAMSMQEAPDKEPNTVLTVVQKGYTLNDRLVRPAMVIVATGGQKKQGADEYERTSKGDGGNVDEQA